MNTVLKVENLSKLYRLGEVGSKTLSDDIKRSWYKLLGKEDPFKIVGQVNTRDSKAISDYVWALKDINFEVQQGEVLGIIGKNGAGKSTLLKILSKITGPTSGKIQMKGRVGSLLEVGTGMHPDLTARENVYLNGAILGMTKAEIRNKFDEIVDFAGVALYIDTPVKRFSSGMRVRLGFAVAAFLEPEILIVDEVLAVGDAEFQKKAIGKMKDISQGEGRTVLFVSHNMTSIESLCTRALLMENGQISESGNVKDIVDLYIKSNFSKKYSTILDTMQIHNNCISINQITINNSPSTRIHIDNKTKYLNLVIDGNLTVKKRMSIKLSITDSKQNLLAFYSPSHTIGEIKEFNAGNFKINENITLPKNITKGEFFLNFSIAHPQIELYASSMNKIILNTKGVLTQTGVELDYSQVGFILMD
jgi:lipopolysaccharide transport system ATP-binding protein